MDEREAFEHHPEADSFDFNGVVGTVRRAIVAHRWAVIATAFTTTLLVSLYIAIWPATYQAEVMLAADSEKDIQRTAFYQGWNVFRRENLTDEATLMAGPPVLREVVERLDLKYADVYHPFLRYTIHLWAQSWIGRNYRRLKLRLTGDKAAAALTDEQIEQNSVLSDFEQGVNVKQVGEADIGLLVVRASTPRVAEIANTIAEVYLRQRRERYVAEARQAYESLTEEAARTQAELADLDRQMKAFRAESGAVLVFETDRGLIGQWLVMRAAVTDLEAAAAQNEASLRIVERQLAAEGARLASDKLFRQNADKDRLPRLEQDLIAARLIYQPDSREVRSLEEQIRAAMSGLQDDGDKAVVVRNSMSVGESYETLLAKKLALESGLAGTRSALAIKRGEAESMRNLIDRIPEKMQVNRELERRQTTLENKYSGIAEKLTVATVSMASARSAPAALRVVEPAHVPEAPVWPQSKLLIAAAVLGGLVFGVLVALLLEVVFERVNRSRLDGRSGGLRLFAVIERDERFLRTLFPRLPSS